MFFANEIASKDKLSESYKLISMIEDNQPLNSTKSNLANYVQTIRDWEKIYVSTVKKIISHLILLKSV